jgi:hypothetical protein
MIHPRNESTNRYPLFNELIPEYTKDSKLLDYGGASGNLLHFSNGDINEETYTSVDVVEEAIIAGKKEFPKAQFVHLNKYNEMYNHDGTNDPYVYPVMTHRDFIWSYSVFSHMVIEDIIETLYWFRSLNPKKVLTSYLCNDGDENSKKIMEYFYQRRINKYNTSVDFRGNRDDHFYLTDNNYGVSSGETFIAVYKTSWIISKLKEHGIIAKKVNSSNTPIPFLDISYEN